MQTFTVPDRFARQTAVVTGAASGIGRATAIRLGAEGAKVLCLDVQEEAASATVEAVTQLGGTATARACDVSDPTQCTDAVTEAVASWGRLDVLCNVAGVLRSDHADRMSDESWNQVLAVNLSGPFFMSRAALPHLLEQRGAIVNVASTAGVMGQAYLAAYAASKHGVVGLTRSLAIEFARKGLRVNAVCPGGVDTAMTQGIVFPDDANYHLVMRAALVDETQPPESVASLISWLGSEEARFVNGAVVPIDAGVTAG